MDGLILQFDYFLHNFLFSVSFIGSKDGLGCSLAGVVIVLYLI
jgi:hypothetical protein